MNHSSAVVRWSLQPVSLGTTLCQGLEFVAIEGFLDRTSPTTTARDHDVPEPGRGTLGLYVELMLPFRRALVDPAHVRKVSDVSFGAYHDEPRGDERAIVLEALVGV